MSFPNTHKTNRLHLLHFCIFFTVILFIEFIYMAVMFTKNTCLKKAQ